ncbi:MAG: decarboxylase, partial [Gammaproteobacteria bacterium]|nr:decarboxylase [Gammaproteobacteria bacterium]
MNSLRFNQFLHSVADTGMELLRTRLRSTIGQSKTLTSLCQELLSTRGEASGIAIARDIVTQYRNLNKEERLQFFEMVNDEFSVDTDNVALAAEDFYKQRDAASLRRLTEQVEPQRQELIRRINMAPGGTATIVEMRRDLLAILKQCPHLEPVDYDFKHLLSSWFNRGFLEIEQINWETPAIILEKLIQYE